MVKLEPLLPLGLVFSSMSPTISKFPFAALILKVFTPEVSEVDVIKFPLILISVPAETSAKILVVPKVTVSALLTFDPSILFPTVNVAGLKGATVAILPGTPIDTLPVFFKVADPLIRLLSAKKFKL